MQGRSQAPERNVPAAEWKIQKRSRACAACDRHFVDGERYNSALREVGDSLSRSDYCARCWAALGEAAKGTFSFWRGTFSMEEPPREEEAIEATRAENLLASLVRSAEPDSRKLAYVFALLLERKKKLVGKGRTERDGRTYIIYEHPRTGQAYMVEDMNIDLSEAGEIQRGLNEILATEGIIQLRSNRFPSSDGDNQQSSDEGDVKLEAGS